MREGLATCTACRLYDLQERNARVVPGKGPLRAKYMFVGEAPGFAEALRGEPFVGPAGAKLDLALVLPDIKRGDCYITNVVKHRPPDNRDPLADEIRACLPWLIEEVAAVQPQVIVALGNVAIAAFKPGLKLAREHGKSCLITWHGAEYTFVPMYHPSYALRDPSHLIWNVMVDDFKRLPSEVLRAREELLKTEYSLCEEGAAARVVRGWHRVEPVGFDYETTSVKKGRWFDAYGAEVLSYSFAPTPGLAHHVPARPNTFRGILEDENIPIIAHNAKFEYMKSKQLGITMTNFHCTMVMAFMLQQHALSLKALARQYLGVDPRSFKEVTTVVDKTERVLRSGKNKGQVRVTEKRRQVGIEEVPLAEVIDYACSDSDNALRLFPIFKAELQRLGMWELYTKVELPLIPVLARMEEWGVGVDEGYTQALLEELVTEIEAARTRCYAVGLPRSCDVGSNDQLAHTLEVMGAPITERTEAKHQLKTDEVNLVQAMQRGWRPLLLQSILTYRQAIKLHSYVVNFLALRGKDGRLHPSIKQSASPDEQDYGVRSAPATARLSYEAPNLQQVPHHGLTTEGEADEEKALRIRRCLVARPGWSFVAGDMSQEEPRITAFLSNDPAMLADFAAGVPIYAPFGKAIYHRPITKADKKEWHVSKTAMLSAIYGSTYTKLLEIEPRLDQAGAESAWKSIHDRYRRLFQYGEEVKRFVSRHGYVRDWFGRMRWLPAVFSNRPEEREAAYREAINDTIQSPAATVMKKVLVRLEAALRARGLQAELSASIHDEVIVECPDGEVDTVREMLYHCTDGIMPIDLPVVVTSGKSWGEMR